MSLPVGGGSCRGLPEYSCRAAPPIRAISFRVDLWDNCRSSRYITNVILDVVSLVCCISRVQPSRETGEMSAVRSISATSILQTSAKSSASRAAPRHLDQQKGLCRSLSVKSRSFAFGTGSIKPRKAASLLTLVCAVGTAPGRAYASAMTQTKSATFAAVGTCSHWILIQWM